jgi:DNA-binding CsgD family transcriptional regulator
VLGWNDMMRRDIAPGWMQPVGRLGDAEDGRDHGVIAPASRGANAICDLLGQLGTAVILIDAAGGIVGISAAASASLDQALLIHNRRLAAADPRSDRALAGLIDKALGRDGGSTDGCVVVERHDSRPLMLRVLALDRPARSLFRPACAMVIVLDVARVMVPTEEQLAGIFALSRGEARLARRLAAGDTLATAAQSCGISYETARKRLKAAFEKTDTRRQAELVALLIRIGSIGGDAAHAVQRRSATPPAVEAVLALGLAPVPP